ncbi:unnamed protein product [Aureobasidium pullulans]|nr:unnamed protein product [Aureobasidium pullulans]
MSSFGKLYTYPGNPANSLNLDIVHTEPAKGVETEYLKLNKLGKVPTFEGADGYVLTECIAIAIYLTSQNEKTTLLGKTKQDYASILRWMSFANTEVLTALGGWFRPLIGRDPYNKKSVDTAQEATAKAVGALEDHFLVNTYLVGERLTLADIFAAGIISRGFQYFFDKEWRSNNPNVTRWFETVTNQSIYSDAKHPIEALGRPTFQIDELKRKYSNEETREVALPWFWENVNFEEYSLWRMDYKYNDELTLTFMSNNQIGGFFTRLEASRKYIFGAASVYGSSNDSLIRGAFLVRGQEALPAFDVAPDVESYEFKKLDPKNPEDKKFVEAMWAWDEPAQPEGKEWADGKVFK